MAKAVVLFAGGVDSTSSQCIRLGTKACVQDERPIKACAPLLCWDKAKIAPEGMWLGAPYQLAWSCSRGEELASGVCDSFQLRVNGFREAGFVDPLPYRERRQA